MSNWLDRLQSALADFDRPGRTLDAALADLTDATPEDLGRAVRALYGEPAPGHRPPDIDQVAKRLGDKLTATAQGIRDGLPYALHDFDQSLLERFRGQPEDQRKAGLILTREFTQFGWTQAGQVLADPSGTIWSDLLPANELYEGRWLVLGWPRERGLRPVWRMEHVLQYTAALESDRRRALAEHAAEQHRRDESARRAWEQSPAGKIAALETELARLRAQQTPAE